MAPGDSFATSGPSKRNTGLDMFCGLRRAKITAVAKNSEDIPGDSVAHFWFRAGRRRKMAGVIRPMLHIF